MLKQAPPKFTPAEAEKMKNQVFRIYDINQNGFKDFHLIMTDFMILTGEAPKDVLKRVFRMFDVNSDGIITQ